MCRMFTTTIAPIKCWTMDYVDGIKLKNLKLKDEGANPGLLPRKVCEPQSNKFLKTVFFHADPHPGNILVTEGNKLCLIDWGMVGRLTVRDRYELINMISSVVDKNSERLVGAILAFAIMEEEVDRRSLERDLLDILDVYYGIPVKDLDVGKFLVDITHAMKEHRLRIPPDFALMVKALITVEGTARQLYPELNIISEAEPLVRKIAAQRFSPHSIWRNFRASMSQFFTFQGQLPKRLGQIIDKLNKGDISIRFEHENLDGLQKTFENIFNRLTLGIITGAMIIGIFHD